jgi:hypothetical protein
LKVDKYWAYVLPKLAKVIHKRDLKQKLGKLFRQGNPKCKEEVIGFVKELLHFTDGPIEVILRNAVMRKNTLQRVKKQKEDDENDIIDWVKKMQLDETTTMRQQPLTITRKPTATAESILKNIYRTRFDTYNPFYIDLGLQFDMSSWIAIRLINKDNSKENIENNDDEQELFGQIVSALANGNLCVITGVVL